MRACAALLCLLLFAAPATAEVKVTTRADGLKVIYNETPAQRARRASGTLLPVPEPGWEPLIQRHSRDQALEPRLVQAVIQVESGYNPRALSAKGAMGLMQLMPDTARELAVTDPYDPEENLRAGTTYLRRLLDRFSERLEWALAAYNAGPTVVDRHRGIPPYPETRDYVTRVLSLYKGRSLSLPRGRTPFIVRENGRIVITTEPPGGD